MKPCFADTFFFLAWWNRRDQAHGRVNELLGGYAGRLHTTRWVLMEVADAFAGSCMRREVRGLFEEMEEDDQIVIAEPTDALYRRGLALYDARPDKEWSLTDCISFVVMADEGLAEALTGTGTSSRPDSRRRSCIETEKCFSHNARETSNARRPRSMRNTASARDERTSG